MWLETPLVDHNSALFCFYLLFVSTLEDATIKSVSRSVFFSQYPWQKSNTWLKNTHFIQPEKPLSGSHTSLSDGSQTLTDSPHVWLSLAEWLQVREEWDSPLGWKTENQYVSLWTSSDIYFKSVSERECHAWRIRVLKTWSKGEYAERKWPESRSVVVSLVFNYYVLNAYVKHF